MSAQLKAAIQPVLDSLCALDGVEATIAIGQLTPKERAVLRSALIELGFRASCGARVLDGALSVP